METNGIELLFDNDRKSFVLCHHGIERLLFNNFELNFKLTRVSLKSSRVCPQPTQDASKFDIYLWGLSSFQQMTMHEPSGQLSAYPDASDNIILIQYKHILKECNFSPDQAIKLTITDIPCVTQSILYHNRSNEFRIFDCEGLWWSQALFTDDISKKCVNDWGLLSLWKYNDGTVCGILPITNDTVLGRLRGECGQGISAISCTGRPEQVLYDYPILIVAFGKSPYDVIAKLYGRHKQLYPQMPTRKQILPSPFDAIGWCSWNAFGTDVTSDKIKCVADTFAKNNQKIKYFLIDDGWFGREMEKPNTSAQGISEAKLASIMPDKNKFPDGMNDVVNYLQTKGVEHCGLWHAMNGYWNGVSALSPFFKENPEWFMKTVNGWYVPTPQSGFYAFWYKQMKQWGISFLKVDNQGFHRECLAYSCNLPKYSAQLQRTQQNAATENAMPVIACMATHPETIFNLNDNQLLRASNDFIPNDCEGARKHIVNNFYNSIWMQHLVWPDFDMFQTKDKHAMTMARMLALSASPIYTTDNPSQIDYTILNMLAFNDGTIPRYDHLPVVLESRFFNDPFKTGNILAIKTEISDRITIGIFNTSEDGLPFSGSIATDEIGLTNEKYLIYSHLGQFEPTVIDKQSNIAIHLDNLQSDLLTLSPIKNGFAITGVINYLAAPAVVQSVEIQNDQITIKLHASGIVLFYCQTEPMQIICGNRRLERHNLNNYVLHHYSFNNGVIMLQTDCKEITLLS